MIFVIWQVWSGLQGVCARAHLRDRLHVTWLLLVALLGCLLLSAMSLSTSITVIIAGSPRTILFHRSAIWSSISINVYPHNVVERAHLLNPIKHPGISVRERIAIHGVIHRDASPGTRCSSTDVVEWGGSAQIDRANRSIIVFILLVTRILLLVIHQ